MYIHVLTHYRLLATKTTFSPFCTAGSNGEQEYSRNPEVDTSELVELVQKGETERVVDVCGVHNMHSLRYASGDVQLIDVREPYEIEEMGLLAPNAINIPCKFNLMCMSQLGDLNFVSNAIYSTNVCVRFSCMHSCLLCSTITHS